jgi:integrase
MLVRIGLPSRSNPIRRAHLMGSTTRISRVSCPGAIESGAQSCLKRRTKPGNKTVNRGGKDFLTKAEMKRFLDAARGGRHGTRDHAMMFMTYRHGFRVSELIDLRMRDIDLDSAHLYVRRKKGSLSTH